MLGKYTNDMRRIMRSTERTVVESAPAFRSTQSEVEKLVEAMLNGAQVKPKATMVLGKDGDVDAFLEELKQALFPVVIWHIQRSGGKVSGASLSTVKTTLRGMAQGNAPQGEDVPPPPKPEV